MFNVRVKYTKKITIGNQNMVWRKPILFLPSCKDFYMYYNQRAWMTPPYNKQLIEGHTSWGLWTYLNSSCCNTLSISYSANNVLRGGDGETAQTFIVETVLFNFTLKGKKKNPWSTVVESGAVLGYWICSLWRIWWLSSRWHHSWINERQGHICYCTDYQLWHATSQSYFLSHCWLSTVFKIIIIDW